MAVGVVVLGMDLDPLPEFKSAACQFFLEYLPKAPVLRGGTFGKRPCQEGTRVIRGSIHREFTAE